MYGSKERHELLENQKMIMDALLYLLSIHGKEYDSKKTVRMKVKIDELEREIKRGIRE